MAGTSDLLSKLNGLLASGGGQTAVGLSIADAPHKLSDLDVLRSLRLGHLRIDQRSTGSAEATLEAAHGLAESLDGPQLPGIGFALGADRILLSSRHPIEEMGLQIKVYVVALGEAAQREALKLATELRGQGIPCDLDLMGRGMKGQMKDADRSGARWAAILGQEELDANEVILRDLQSGDQQRIAQALNSGDELDWCATRGQTAVQVAPQASMLIVPDAMRQFRRRYPNARVRIVEGVSTALLPAVRDETFDFAIAGSLRRLDPGLRVAPFATLPSTVLDAEARWQCTHCQELNKRRDENCWKCEEPRIAPEQQIAFFGGGAMLLLASLSAVSWVLKIGPRTGRLPPASNVALEREPGRPRPVFPNLSIHFLALRSTWRRPNRSLLTVSLIALASFLLVTVAAMRQAPPTDPGDRRLGTGGYRLIVQAEHRREGIGSHLLAASPIMGPGRGPTDVLGLLPEGPVPGEVSQVTGHAAQVAVDEGPVAFGAAAQPAQAGRSWEARRIQWHAVSADVVSDQRLGTLENACQGVGGSCDYGLGTHGYQYDPELDFPDDPWRDLPGFSNNNPDDLPVEP